MRVKMTQKQNKTGASIRHRAISLPISISQREKSPRCGPIPRCNGGKGLSTVDTECCSWIE